MPVLKTAPRVSATIFWFALGAAVTNASTITDLGNLGGCVSQASEINNSGEVVGTCTGGPVNIPFAWQQGSGMVNLGTLGGSLGGVAFAINDAGQITGDSFTSGSTFHAFVTTSGSAMTDLGALATSGSVGEGLNDLGQVTGYSYAAGGTQNAFLYTPGLGMVSLGTFGGSAGSAFDVNNAGQVVGYSIRPLGAMAILYTPGVGSVDLGILGQGTSSQATAVNEAGVVVGYSKIDGSTASHAFVYTPGVGLTDLGTLAGATSSYADDINELGQIVGSSSGTSANAFLYSGGVMTDLNTFVPGSGWQLSAATGINDHGQITGYGINPQGQRSSFLLDISSSDVPEPATIWLAAGILGLGGLLRKRGITK